MYIRVRKQGVIHFGFLISLEHRWLIKISNSCYKHAKNSLTELGYDSILDHYNSEKEKVEKTDNMAEAIIPE